MIRRISVLLLLDASKLIIGSGIAALPSVADHVYGCASITAIPFVLRTRMVLVFSSHESFYLHLCHLISLRLAVFTSRSLRNNVFELADSGTPSA